MPSTRRGRSWPAKPAIIPAWVEPVTVQTTMVSKKTPSSASCCATSSAQLAKPSPPSGCSEAPAGMAYGVAAAAPRPPRCACSQRVADPDVEAGGVEAHVGAHDPGQQDVADLVVDASRASPPTSPAPARTSARASRPRRRPAGCGWTGRRRSRRACRRPGPARPGRGTPACGSCCRRRRARSCSPRAWPRSAAPPRCAVSRSSGCTGLGPEGQRVAREVSDGHGVTVSLVEEVALATVSKPVDVEALGFETGS